MGEKVGWRGGKREGVNEWGERMMGLKNRLRGKEGDR